MDRRIAELEEQVEKLTEVSDGLVDMNQTHIDIQNMTEGSQGRRIKSLERGRIITNLALLATLATLWRFL